MKISGILNKARRDKKLLEAEVLMADALGKSREWVVSNVDYDLSAEEVRSFHSVWTRFLQGEPVAYLTGNKEFYGIEFCVDKRVLIPRPETELLVEKVLSVSGDPVFASKKSVQVIDVGTGSGAIAVSLAKNSECLKVFASEIERDACDIASINIEKNEADVVLRCGDLLEPFKDEDFDIIVANLPYIGRDLYEFVDENVAKYEPDSALYGGEDGLSLYGRLFDQVKEYGMSPKFIFGEIGCLQGEAVKSLVAEKFPDVNIEIGRDLAGLDRNFIISFV